MKINDECADVKKRASTDTECSDGRTLIKIGLICSQVMQY